MPSQPGFWRVEDRLKELSAQGDPLEQLQQIVEVELVRPLLATATRPVDRSEGGRPPFEAVLKFKMFYLQAQHGLRFEQTERLVRDRLSWMRFCGLSIADPVPDATTLWDFREALIAAGAFETLFERLDQAIKAGRTAGEIWPDEPAKAAQKDTDARWTVKSSKGKPKADGTVQSDLNIPEFGYKTHISIDVEHGFIRRQKVTDAAAHDGARLREGLIDPTTTASSVCADTASRSAANEHFLADRGKVSRIHRTNPAGKPMPKRTARANAKKSKVRARIEHVFAHQKERMRLVIRSVGLKRAEATVTMANIAYNLGRWRWWETRTASA